MSRQAGGSPVRRKRDGEERRRELCDAAIQVLAEHGSRGLTHQNVDRTAGLPEGSTSYYYRTRAALLQGVGMRVAEIDRANLRSVTETPVESASPFARLAQLTMLESEGFGLMLNRARHELLLNAMRDPELAEMSAGFIERVVAMTQEAIAGLQPHTDDQALLEAQTSGVLTVIAGAFTRFVSGDRTFTDADQLARLMQAVVRAVAEDHATSTRDAQPQSKRSTTRRSR